MNIKDPKLVRRHHAKLCLSTDGKLCGEQGHNENSQPLENSV